MSTPIQVDASLLQKLIREGPAAINQDIPVYNESIIGTTGSTPQGSPPVPTVESTPPQNTRPATFSSGQQPTRLPFQPQRKYYIQGRIIHKRKLSRKLFFLDVSLVRRKRSLISEDGSFNKDCNTSASSITSGGTIAVSGGTSGSIEDGFKLSVWEGIESPHHGSADGQEHQQTRQQQHQDQLQEDGHSHDKSVLRIEVIARYPVHSLKEIDDLWRKVQLGSVVEVNGDIELSQRNRGHDDNSDGDVQHSQWTAILHCLDFEILELWQGEETFEPNPGSSVTHATSKKEQDQNSTMKQSRKRKSAEVDADVSGLVVGQELRVTAKKQQRGDPSQPHCKFWLNSGKCNKDICLFWHETDPVKLKAERRRWVEERIRAKRQISHHASDPHQKTTKNQHRERALYFAQWLVKTFSRDALNSGSGVLDIAGGRGDLSWELQTRQGIQSTIIEPRPGKGMRKWQRKWLHKFVIKNKPAPMSIPTENTADDGTEANTTGLMMEDECLLQKGIEDPEEQEPDEGEELEGLGDFIPTILTRPLQGTEPARIQAMLDDQFLITHQDLMSGASILIGLHPDQATEPIVRAAFKVGKPFAVIPCCVFGRDNPHRRLPRHPAKSETVDSMTKECILEEDEDPLTRPVTSYSDFVTWLSTLHPEIETTWLNFEGMNRVLFWRGPSASSGKTVSEP